MRHGRSAEPQSPVGPETTGALYPKVVIMVDAEIPSDDTARRGLLTSFSLEEVALLQVIIDTVIPEDAYPGGWTGGVAALLENPVGAMDELVEPLRAAVRRLDMVARDVDGRPFVELSPARRLELVEREYLAGTGGQDSALELEVRGGPDAPDSVSGFSDGATGEAAQPNTVRCAGHGRFRGLLRRHQRTGRLVHGGLSAPPGRGHAG